MANSDTSKPPKNKKPKKSDLNITGCISDNCNARKKYQSRCYLAPQEERPCIITLKDRG